MELMRLVDRGGRAFRALRAAAAWRKSRTPQESAWAREYLIRQLGEGRGVSAKVGQLLASYSSSTDRSELLAGSLPAMSNAEVSAALQAAYGTALSAVFSSVEISGRPASLGEVHRAALVAGGEAAVKIRYPDIGPTVEAEMTLLGLMPGVGPAAKWGVDLEGYKTEFRRALSEELDYAGELRRQSRYRQIADELPGLVVPRPFPELSREGVLVQEWVESQPLSKAETLSEDDRRQIGALLVRHVMAALFRHGFVHADPHPGNYGWSRDAAGRLRLVLYDYGSVLEVGRRERLALVRLILAAREKAPLAPAEALEVMGFDAGKLKDLGDLLPAMMIVILEPFLLPGAYDCSAWRPGERLEAIAGDLKWWFRSAGPADLILLMRVIHGLSIQLQRLGVSVSWSSAFDEEAAVLFEEARGMEFPGSAAAGRPFSGLAGHLRIEVTAGGQRCAELSFPARCAEDIAGLMDDDLRARLAEAGMDLREIQERVTRSGYSPQRVFELDRGEKRVRVWLQ